MAISADAIVVAAGRSTRMGGVDKLAWSIAGRPLLAHTLEAVARIPGLLALVLVVPAEAVDEVAGAPWLPDGVTAVVAGGERRQDSVASGFAALERLSPDPAGTRPVLVHDGARPMLTPVLGLAVVEATARHGAAIPTTPVAETVKRVVGDQVVETVARDQLGLAQTPQGVQRAILRDALQSAGVNGRTSDTWTDEAALLESRGVTVHTVPGDPDNLKVTIPADLARVAALLGHAHGHGDRRTGIGQDSHPFGAGQPLQLGGVTFDGVPALAGHSDGDVALHAVADALLGASGLGDLGRRFPADRSTPRGVASTNLLAEVVRDVQAGGWRPATVDLTIIGARPRLGARLDEMRARIAAIIDVEIDRVNVKASSGNLDGSEGAGRSISALAIASIDAFDTTDPDPTR